MNALPSLAHAKTTAISAVLMAINHVTVRGLVILRQTFVQLHQAAQPTGAPAGRGEAPGGLSRLSDSETTDQNRVVAELGDVARRLLVLVVGALALARTERPELKSKRCACALAGFRRA